MTVHTARRWVEFTGQTHSQHETGVTLDLGIWLAPRCHTCDADLGHRVRGWRLTDPSLTSDGGRVLTLQELIQARRDERGWSFADLENRAGHRISRGRWQQLATNVRMRAFPERDNIPVLASVLEVDETTVVLAAAKSLGLDVRWRGPDLAALMPAGTDQLSEPVRDAILAVIRATVSEAIARATSDDEPRRTVGSGPSVLEWGKSGPAPAQRGQPASRGGQASDANSR